MSTKILFLVALVAGFIGAMSGMGGEWGPNLVCTCGAVIATVTKAMFSPAGHQPRGTHPKRPAQPGPRGTTPAQPVTCIRVSHPADGRLLFNLE